MKVIFCIPAAVVLPSDPLPLSSDFLLESRKHKTTEVWARKERVQWVKHFPDMRSTYVQSWNTGPGINLESPPGFDPNFHAQTPLPHPSNKLQKKKKTHVYKHPDLEFPW